MSWRFPFPLSPSPSESLLYSVLSPSGYGKVLSLKPFIGEEWREGWEEDQGTTQIPSTVNPYIKG